MRIFHENGCRIKTYLLNYEQDQNFMRYKIVFVGQKYSFDPDFAAGQLSLMNDCEVVCSVCATPEDAMIYFFSYDPILLLVIEEDIIGVAGFVEQLRIDEVFQYLPIILLVEKNDADKRKIFFSLGIDNLLEYTCDPDEFIMGCHSAIKYKVRLDTVMERLRVVTEENITRSIQLDILRRYLPESVWTKTENLAASQAFHIPEEAQSLAVLFADLKSFTSMAELLDPQSVISLLNDVFGLAVRIIYLNEGDIDKFIGDAFLAVFHNPSKSLAAALKIQKEMRVMNKTRKKAGKVPIQFRIGIHYGNLIRGSVGGHRRYDHTLIGDVVNTAQRLESMAEPGGLLVSEDLIGRIRDFPMQIEDFQQIDLKGKSVPVRATPLGLLMEKDTTRLDKLIKHLEN